MKKSNFRDICNELSPPLVAKFFDVERTYIYRLMSRGYAPPEWNYNLVQLTKGKYSLKDLQEDIVNHKTNSIPMVDKKQVDEFLSPCHECRQLVGKNRQKGVA